VNFAGPATLIGRFVDVLITEALPHSLRGRLADLSGSACAPPAAAIAGGRVSVAASPPHPAPELALGASDNAPLANLRGPLDENLRLLAASVDARIPR